MNDLILVCAMFNDSKVRKPRVWRYVPCAPVTEGARERWFVTGP
jgi:hypothetical protein